jgi:nucleoside-diphosphate-sugar epimerase
VHEPVNLGNPVEFTIRQLADEVLRIVGGDVQVTYRPLPQDDPTKRKPDITRARELLGWEPRISLTEGLSHTVEYFRSRTLPEFRAGSAFRELAGTREPSSD